MTNTLILFTFYLWCFLLWWSYRSNRFINYSIVRNIKIYNSFVIFLFYLKLLLLVVCCWFGVYYINLLWLICYRHLLSFLVHFLLIVLFVFLMFVSIWVFEINRLNILIRICSWVLLLWLWLGLCFSLLWCRSAICLIVLSRWSRQIFIVVIVWSDGIVDRSIDSDCIIWILDISTLNNRFSWTCCRLSLPILWTNWFHSALPFTFIVTFAVSIDSPWLMALHTCSLWSFCYWWAPALFNHKMQIPVA